MQLQLLPGWSPVEDPRFAAQTLFALRSVKTMRESRAPPFGMPSAIKFVASGLQIELLDTGRSRSSEHWARGAPPTARRPEASRTAPGGASRARRCAVGRAQSALSPRSLASRSLRCGSKPRASCHKQASRAHPTCRTVPCHVVQCVLHVPIICASVYTPM